MIKSKLSLINNNKYLLPYLLIISGCVLGYFQVLVTHHNLSIIYKETMFSSVGNLFLFAAFYVVGKGTYDSYFKNYYFITREADFKKVVKNSIKDITLYTLYFYLIYVLTILTISFMFSFEGRSIGVHNVYNINLLVYNIYITIRNGFILTAIINIVFILKLFDNKYLSLIVLFLNIIFYMISIFGDTLFNKYKIVIIPQDYLTNELIYGTFYMDVINTALVILILFGIVKLIFNYVIKKKRDII